MSAPSALVDGKKLCPRCEAWKPLDEYYKAAKRPHGVRPWCKACCNSDNAARTAADPDKARAQGRERSGRWYAKDPEHARALQRAKEARQDERQRQLKRDRSTRHKTRWREENRDLSRAQARAGTRRWRERHPNKAADSSRTNATNRRAAKRNGGTAITADLWARVVEIFDGLCAYCRSETKVGMDHFVPLASGGKHVLSNLVPCCRRCNSSKRHRDPFDWMESRALDGDLVVALIHETRRLAA